MNRPYGWLALLVRASGRSCGFRVVDRRNGGRGAGGVQERRGRRRLDAQHRSDASGVRGQVRGRAGPRPPGGPARMHAMPIRTQSPDLRSPGRPRSALAMYTGYLELYAHDRAGWDNELRGPSLERVGQLYDEAGDLENAAVYYARFVELWANANAELQPRVEVARARLAEIIGSADEEADLRDPPTVPVAGAGPVRGRLLDRAAGGGPARAERGPPGLGTVAGARAAADWLSDGPGDCVRAGGHAEACRSGRGDRDRTGPGRGSCRRSGRSGCTGCIQRTDEGRSLQLAQTQRIHVAQRHRGRRARPWPSLVPQPLSGWSCEAPESARPAPSLRRG